MSKQSSGPWWKFGYVWMVVGGPAVVVVASFTTLYLAITRPDPLVDSDYYRKGIEINKTLDDTAGSRAPAETGRNHAATGAMSAKPSESQKGVSR